MHMFGSTGRMLDQKKKKYQNQMFALTETT